MTKLRCHLSDFWGLSKLALPCLALCCFAHGQVLNKDQELEVHHLPSLMARTSDPSDVLLTSLDTIIHDRAICCGKDSALEDGAQAADPKSLKDVAERLQGRHLLSDGRPIMVTTEYLPAEQASSGHLITMILNQHAAIVQWNSHLYVVHGVVYLWIGNHTPDGGGGTEAVMHKLLLWDTRYSDSRREVVFDRDTDDVSKVHGFLFLEAKPQ